MEDNYYIVDRKNRIIEVSDMWDDFAAENSGHSSMKKNIIGRSV